MAIPFRCHSVFCQFHLAIVGRLKQSQERSFRKLLKNRVHERIPLAVLFEQLVSNSWIALFVRGAAMASGQGLGTGDGGAG